MIISTFLKACIAGTTFAIAASAGASAEPYEYQLAVPKCKLETVAKIFPAAVEERTAGEDRFQRSAAGASGIVFTSDMGMVTPFRYSPTLEASRRGDRVEVCIISIMKGCPKGDNRGTEYFAKNRRTGLSWTGQNGSHQCGGA